MKAQVQSFMQPNFKVAAMNEKTEFAERLKQAMKGAGYEARPAVLEKQFNSRYWGKSVTFQAAARWLAGKSIPSQEKLQVLAEWLAIEPQELRYGAHAIRASQEKRARWDSGMAPEDRELVEALLKLPVAQKKIVKEVILAFGRPT